MREAAGSEESSTLAPELDRHLDMLSRGIACASPAPVTLILRAPCSAPAKALIAMQDRLSRAGMRATAILTRLEPEDDLRQLFACLSALSPQDPAAALIRVARNPRLHDAHEQAVYGDTLCWSGDAMRRDAERRNTLSLFHDGAPGQVRLARLAFAALWAASTPVPERYLRGEIKTFPKGEYAGMPETPAAISPLFLSPQGWPLIRH